MVTQVEVPAILAKVFAVMYEHWLRDGVANLPRVIHVHPRDWSALERYAALTMGLHHRRSFPRFTLETDYGDLIFQSSQAQVPGQFAAEKG